MSADAGNPDVGPTIFTVEGQEGHVSTVPVVEAKVEPVEEVKTEVAEVKKEEVEEAPAAGSEEQAEQDRDDKGRFKPTAKERIDQLTRARRDAERDAEYWKNVATGKIVPPAKEETAAAAKSNEPPVRENFESEEAYLDALTDHKVEVKLAEREQQAQQTKTQQTKAESWNSKLAAARTEIADFDAVMNAATLPVQPHVAELITEHQQGAKVIHHFALNPAELEKINAMSPAGAAFAIAELAFQFKAPASEAASSSKPEAVAKKVSEAPPPAARNVGSGRSTTVPLGEQSMEDYVATRKAQGARWAR